MGHQVLSSIKECMSHQVLCSVVRRVGHQVSFSTEEYIGHQVNIQWRMHGSPSVVLAAMVGHQMLSLIGELLG